MEGGREAGVVGRQAAGWVGSVIEVRILTKRTNSSTRLLFTAPHCGNYEATWLPIATKIFDRS